MDAPILWASEGVQNMEKNFNIDWAIEVKDNGKVNKAAMVKVAKFLKENKVRKGATCFIKDINGASTCWSLADGSFSTYRLDCEFTEDETKTGEDHYNEIEYNWKGGKPVEVEYSSYKVW